MFSERVCYDFSTTAINAVKFNVLIHLVADKHSVLSHIYRVFWWQAWGGQDQVGEEDAIWCFNLYFPQFLFAFICLSFVHYFFLLATIVNKCYERKYVESLIINRMFCVIWLMFSIFSIFHKLLHVLPSGMAGWNNLKSRLNQKNRFWISASMCCMRVPGQN